MSTSKKYAEWMSDVGPNSLLTTLREHRSILTHRKRRLLTAALCEFLYEPRWNFVQPYFPNGTDLFHARSLSEIAFAKLYADGKTARGIREEMMANHRGEGFVTVNCLFADVWYQESVVVELLTNQHQVPPTCVAYIIRDLFNPTHSRLDQTLCCCGYELDGGHDHNTCGPPIEERDPCLTTTVVNLAQGIYDDERFCDLPILADALEEAGCTDSILLDHLRETEFDMICLACGGDGGIDFDTGGFEPWGQAISDWRICSYCDGVGYHRNVPHRHFKGCWGIDSVLGRR